MDFYRYSSQSHHTACSTVQQNETQGIIRAQLCEWEPRNSNTGTERQPADPRGNSDRLSTSAKQEPSLQRHSHNTTGQHGKTIRNSSNHFSVIAITPRGIMARRSATARVRFEFITAVGQISSGLLTALTQGSNKCSSRPTRRS